MASTSIGLGEETTRPARVAIAPGLRAARAALVLLLLPVGAYALPRVVNMVKSPHAMEVSIDAAARYNPRIIEVVALETETLAELGALDRIDASLARVRGTVASVDEKMGGVIGRITGDVQSTLDGAVVEVDRLLATLVSLRDSLAAVGRPVDDIDRAIREARATMDRILAEARATGADVRAARASAGASADNVSGPRK